jgi:hypothetical protein
MRTMSQARDPRYAASGVDSTKAEAGLSLLKTWVERTFPLNPHALTYPSVILPTLSAWTG